MKATACMVLLSSLLGANARRPLDDHVVWVGPSPQATRLLDIALDRGQSYKKRVAAIDQLGQRGEAAAVPDLLRLLPGDSDVVTYRTIIALRLIGDRRALPKLLKIRDDPNRNDHGKINVALRYAIAALSKPAD
jgi:HEAT repeat protein